MGQGRRRWLRRIVERSLESFREGIEESSQQGARLGEADDGIDRTPRVPRIGP